MLEFSQVGFAKNNEKHHGDGYAILRDNNVLVISDGASSENGSGKKAVASFEKHFKDTHDISQATEKVIDEEEHAATIVVAEVQDRILRVLNIGDSRAYLVKQKSIHQLTEDHTLYEAIRPHLNGLDPKNNSREEILVKLKADQFTESLLEAIAEVFFSDATKSLFTEQHLSRILRKLGKEKQLSTCLQEVQTSGNSPTMLAFLIRSSVSILTHSLREQKSKDMLKVQEFPINSGEDVLLASDGIHNLFTAEELLNILRPQVEIKDATRTLFEAAKTKGLSDDATFVLGRIAKKG